MLLILILLSEAYNYKVAIDSFFVELLPFHNNLKRKSVIVTYALRIQNRAV